MGTLTAIALIGLGMLIDNLYRLYYHRQIRLAEQDSYLAGFQNGLHEYLRSTSKDITKVGNNCHKSKSDHTPVRVSAEFESGLRKNGRAVQKLR